MKDLMKDEYIKREFNKMVYGALPKINNKVTLKEANKNLDSFNYNNQIIEVVHSNAVVLSTHLIKKTLLKDKHQWKTFKVDVFGNELIIKLIYRDNEYEIWSDKNIGNTIKRKTKNNDSVKLTVEYLLAIIKNVVLSWEQLKNDYWKTQYLSTLEFTDKEIELSKLKYGYSLCNNLEEKKAYLIKKRFNDMGKFGYSKETKISGGRVNGTTFVHDFENKIIKIIGYSDY